MALFIAGWNPCGYMPDNKPTKYDSFNEAKRSLIWDIKNLLEEDAQTEEETEDFCLLAEDVNLESGPFSLICWGYCFWIMELKDDED